MYEFENETCSEYRGVYSAATAAIVLHIYFDLRTYALGRLVKRLLGARASDRQYSSVYTVSFRFSVRVPFSILTRPFPSRHNTICRRCYYTTRYYIIIIYNEDEREIAMKKNPKNRKNASKMSKIAIIQII